MRRLLARGSAALGLTLLPLLLVGISVGLGAGQRSGKDGVRVSFEASVSPSRLPRHLQVPVSLTLSGTIDTMQAAPGTHLASLELDFGSRGGLTTAGLPRCKGLQIENASQRQALAYCGQALVGHGTITAEDLLDPEQPVLAHASVLAFNGTAAGRPAVWVHAFSAEPPVSFVLPFSLRHLGSGSYGVSLRTPVSSALGRWLRLQSFRIEIGRRYKAGGVKRSYLRASCPLPPRFTHLSVPLARATYRFTPDPTLTTPIHRSCSVRE